MIYFIGTEYLWKKYYLIIFKLFPSDTDLEHHLPIAIGISIRMKFNLVVKGHDSLPPRNWAIICVCMNVNILTHLEPLNVSNRVMTKLALICPPLSHHRQLVIPCEF